MFGLARKPKSFFGGIKLPDNKAMSTSRPILKAPIPARLVVPLQQHIGKPSKPCVEIGERVFKGQIIAMADTYVSAPQHAPTSGTVIALGDFPIPHPSGLSGSCIVIEPDNEDQWAPDRKTPADFRSMDPSTLRNHIRDAGIVGMGGAAFPSAVKLNPGPDAKIDTLILNGAECEPYITCDDMLMRENAEQVIRGAEVLMIALGVQRCLIGIEDNKTEAIASMRAACAGAEMQIDICPVPSRYPEGGEKQLIQTLTGREVPADGLPFDIGIVLQNVATAVAIYQALVHGQPLLTRLLTVTGSGIAEPCVVEAMIGTPVTEIVQLCGGYSGEIKRLVMGGPMMGFTLANDRVPIVKSANCILALTAADSAPDESEAMPCIRCGECADVCPSRLLPQQMSWHSRARDFDRVEDHNLFDCIECGCCNLVCPSHIPLVQYFRFAKSEIWAQQQEAAKADIARERHDTRLERLEREEAEKAARIAARKEALNKGSPDGDDKAGKQAAIAAALARAKQKRPEEKPDGATETAKPSAAAAAIARAKAKSDAETTEQPAQKSAAQLAIERAKAKKTGAPTDTSSESPAKSAAQLAIERAKKKTAANEQATDPDADSGSNSKQAEKSPAQLAIERAREASSPPQQDQNGDNEGDKQSSDDSETKSEVKQKSAAELAIERAKAKSGAEQAVTQQDTPDEPKKDKPTKPASPVKKSAAQLAIERARAAATDQSGDKH